MNNKKPRFNFYNSTALLLEVMSPEVCKDFMLNLSSYMINGEFSGFQTKEAEIFWESQKSLYTKQRKAYEVYLKKGNQHSNSKESKKEKNRSKGLKKDLIPYNEVISYFHAHCPEMPRVKKITDTRKRAIKSRMNEHGNEAVAEVIKKANASDFLNGRNGSEFVANLDFIFNKTKFVRILEGQYDNKKKTTKKDSAIQTILKKRNYE